MEGKTNVRVGIFVVVALLLFGVVSFIVGNKSGVFKSKTTYHAIFDDVAGLRPGSSVRVAGLDVGTVRKVTFEETGLIRVEFRVVDDVLGLIRGTPEQAAAYANYIEQREGPTATDDLPVPPKPSLIELTSKGLLGDQLLNITVGDSGLPPWPDEVALPVNPERGLMDRAAAMADDAERTMDNVRLATDPFRDQALSNDVKATMRNLAQITNTLAQSDGAIQRLMTDPTTADEITATLRNLRTTSAEFARAARSARAITDEVRNGDGSAHRILYGPEAADAMANVGRVSGELATVLGDVRTGDGTIHDLIYEDSATELLANLTSMSGDLTHITSEMRAGRGTIGGLLADPSIYEDVKRLVGDLQRNDILRALVRYSIRRDEAVERTDVTEE